MMTPEQSSHHEGSVSSVVFVAQTPTVFDQAASVRRVAIRRIG